MMTNLSRFFVSRESSRGERAGRKGDKRCQGQMQGPIIPRQHHSLYTTHSMEEGGGGKIIGIPTSQNFQASPTLGGVYILHTTEGPIF